MVFIYGGSWNHGATSVNLLNGKAQVQQSIHAGHPVISVTLNYRIGAFGCVFCSIFLTFCLILTRFRSLLAHFWLTFNRRFMAHEDLRDASDGAFLHNFMLFLSCFCPVFVLFLYCFVRFMLMTMTC